MTDRLQNVAARDRKPVPRKFASPKQKQVRSLSGGLWIRVFAAAAFVAVGAAGYVALADSDTFAIHRVEVQGTRRVLPERIEELARASAGPGLLDADLEAVRLAVSSEVYVRTASVVRVLPDVLRVHIEEREPVVVVRLKTGRFAWADVDGHVLESYSSEPGVRMPPPLSGFDEGDHSERALADNRDRVDRYQQIQAALEQGSLWDSVDEVDVHYLKDAKVVLADSGVVVRLGDRDFRDRFTTALSVLKAVRTGDTATLNRYRVGDIGMLIAGAEAIDFIDAARENGVTVAIDKKRLLRAASTAAAAPTTVEPAKPAESKPATQEAPPAKKPPSVAGGTQDSARPAAKPDTKAPTTNKKPSEKPDTSLSGRRN